MSPCFRRTQRPSFRSIAGMMTIAGAVAGSGLAVLGPARARRGGSSGLGLPGNEVGEQLQSGRMAFLGMELYRENVIARHSAGKGEAVFGARGFEAVFLRREEVAVAEVKALTGADVAPQ